MARAPPDDTGASSKKFAPGAASEARFANMPAAALIRVLASLHPTDVLRTSSANRRLQKQTAPAVQVAKACRFRWAPPPERARDVSTSNSSRTVTRRSEVGLSSRWAEERFASVLGAPLIHTDRRESFEVHVDAWGSNGAFMIGVADADDETGTGLAWAFNAYSGLSRQVINRECNAIVRLQAGARITAAGKAKVTPTDARRTGRGLVPGNTVRVAVENGRLKIAIRPAGARVFGAEIDANMRLPTVVRPWFGCWQPRAGHEDQVTLKFGYASRPAS